MKAHAAISKGQAGTTSVEFAIVGLVAMMVLFAVIEFSRLVFVSGSLREATRRGVRMAVVCPINDPAIAQVALFNGPGGSGTSPLVSGLGPGNIAVDYLGITGAPTATFDEIRYVRVRIANYQHRFLVPMFNLTFTMPGFPTTMPRESLGVPRVGTGPLPC